MSNKTGTPGLFACQAELLRLLETLINVIFCAKDLERRYVAVNSAFVRRTGSKSKREVIGTRATDHFSAELAERYEDQDRHVLATGEPLHDQLELIRRSNGDLGWYVTTKLPVRDGTSALIGLVAVSRDLRTPSAATIELESLQDVVRYVHERFGDSIRVSELAALAGCTEAQLERRMKRLFGVTATQYVLRVRVDAAARLLAESDESIASIAARCGFYDQPDFTRRFARLASLTPAQFRLALRESAHAD